MKCIECVLAKCCRGIGDCAENQRKLHENLVIHPNGISEQIAKRICETSSCKCSCPPEWRDTDAFNGDLDKELDAIKERLYEIAEIKQVQLFRLNRNLVNRGVKSPILDRIRDEAFATTAHPEALLDDCEWKYAR